MQRAVAHEARLAVQEVPNKEIKSWKVYSDSRAFTMEDVARAKKAEEEKKAEEARKSAARAARGRGAGSRGRGRGRGRGSDPTDELAALFEDLEVGGGGVEKETDNEEDLLAELEDPTQSLVPSPPSSSHSPHNSEDNWEGAEEELLPVVTRSGRTSRRGGAEVGWWGVTQIERDPGRERLHHKERYKKRSADSVRNDTQT